MIASSAAIFALMASLAAGHSHVSHPSPAPGNALKVLPNPSTRNQAIAACAGLGLQLAAINGANIQAASDLVPRNAFGWVASWEGNNYGGACLQLQAGTITVAGSCDDLNLPVCQGVIHPPHPEPPCPSESSSSTSCSSSSSSSHIPVPSFDSSSSSESSSSCESFSSSSSSSESSCPVFSSDSSYDCDSSSSSFNCYSSSISSECSSSSSSSSGRCDPCCAGVHKLTYQAKFPAGEYLAKVSQKFSVFDVFGPNACTNVGSLANNLGVSAILVGSDGLDACGPAEESIFSAVDTVQNNISATVVLLSGYIEGLPDGNLSSSALAQISATVSTIESQITALISLLASYSNYPIISSVQSAVAAVQAAAQTLGATLNTYASGLSTSTLSQDAIADFNSDSIPAQNDALALAVTNLDSAITASAAIPYGNYYDVSRAWALNSPVYSLLGGTVSAANSLYNCYGEYRAIYITKPLSQLTYVNSRGDACFERCKDKPQSCLYLCGGLKPPGYKIPFRF